MKKISEILSGSFVVILLISYEVIVTKGLGHVAWRVLMPQWLLYIIALPLFVSFFILPHLTNRVPKRPQLIVNLLFFLPLVSVFFKLLFGTNESINIELQYTIIPISALAFFYIFYFLNIKVEYISIALIILGVITFGIQLFQQMNPDLAQFLSDDSLENMEASVRNNVYRFSVGDYMIAVFCVYYFWAKLLINRVGIINLLLFIVFVVSLYFYMTRQILIAVFVTILLSLFIQKNKSQKKALTKAIFLFLLFSVFLVLYFDELFTSTDDFFGTDDDYSLSIRFEFIGNILIEMLKNPIQFLFGHGGYSNIEVKWANKGYFLSDIGFIGYMYRYGLSYVAVYFYTLFYFLKKHNNETPLPAKLYLLGTAINSLFIFPYHHASSTMIWAFMLYWSSSFIKLPVANKQ